MPGLNAILRRLSRPAGPAAVAVAGAAVLLGAHLAGSVLRMETYARRADLAALTESRERTASAASDLQALRDLRGRDILGLQQGISRLAQSKRALFESGIALQEEERLLRNQWQIMTTWLQVDVPGRSISLMRGDQAAETFSLSYSSGAFGSPGGRLPELTQLVSKERFAHPERGRSEEVDGKLVWTPPQVGTSVRANALGEYVMFFRGGLVLHGPPKKREDHAAFPHYCVGLSMAAARKLYRETFIGTKISFKLR